MTNKIRVYGKAQNRTALGIINAYLKLYPQATQEDLNKAFPADLNKPAINATKLPYLLVTEAERLITEKERADRGAGSDNFKTTFEEDPVVLQDETKLFFIMLWQKPEFETIIEWAKQYEIEVAEFNPTESFEKGGYRLEYLNGFVPATAPATTSTPNTTASAPTVTSDHATAAVTDAASEPKKKKNSPIDNHTQTQSEPKKKTIIKEVYVEEKKKHKRKGIFSLLLIALEVIAIIILLWLLMRPKNVVVNEVAKEVVVEKVVVDTVYIPHFNALQFKPGSTELTKESKAVLGDLAKLLNAEKKLKVRIIGHASIEGVADFNQELSEKRAKAAVDVLHNEYNINPERLLFEGKGSSEPIDPNNYIINRRAEFNVIY